jgi:hypothetical protein
LYAAACREDIEDDDADLVFPGDETLGDWPCVSVKGLEREVDEEGVGRAP